MEAWIEILGVMLVYMFFLSLPAWKRGLKYAKNDIAQTNVQSLPAWKRGLKFRDEWQEDYSGRSLPAWTHRLE